MENASKSEQPTEQNTIHGFHYLRAIGLACVLWQHQLSVLNLDQFNSIYGLSVGQIGVAFFLSVSGCLAAVGNRKAWSWLRARVLRIYPAYWIATIVSFVATWLSGYKTFTFWQVVSQFAGTGLFTHPNNLINIATWFVSLILILYLAIFLAKLTYFPNQLILTLTLICIQLAAIGMSSLLAIHAATFFIAYLAFQAKNKTRMFIISGTALTVLSAATGQKLFLQSVIALISIVLVRQVTSTPRLTKIVSDYSYEFYLVHGIFLVGCNTLIPKLPIVSVPIGILISGVTAFFLKNTVDFILKYLTMKQPPILDRV